LGCFFSIYYPFFGHVSFLKFCFFFPPLGSMFFFIPPYALFLLPAAFFFGSHFFGNSSLALSSPFPPSPIWRFALVVGLRLPLPLPFFWPRPCVWPLVFLSWGGFFSPPPEFFFLGLFPNLVCTWLFFFLFFFTAFVYTPKREKGAVPLFRKGLVSLYFRNFSQLRLEIVSLLSNFRFSSDRDVFFPPCCCWFFFPTACLVFLFLSPRRGQAVLFVPPPTSVCKCRVLFFVDFCRHRWPSTFH